ncbi:histidine--tRNA ligase [Demequina sp. TTPB684]|uniref:histidine--tRNA ligase n=1 Tax=unclassified Demequina TaxID=2620311 RepID=UPI001CF4D43B|nr:MULTISPECIES: histidine--tRNA ligase [unclassified Demequina]MCB2414069.1 histidine--tRNA ligase [Demequina sp. TTPB684]UPU89220.1 histidine--tRNA ligase [Demequina sp. TMPB413]
MSRLAPLSGFPEWSPAERIVEAFVLDTLRDVFALHGFGEIETRAVEPLERLGGEAEASKEVYTLLRRGGDKAEFGLHFDLTVPFARYVEERQGQLHFPFRRFQIQKVWRGERPQEGRFREFYQADIDVVARESLPAHFEAEVAVVMAKALAALPLPPARMRMNDRRLVEGFYRGVGIDDVAAALRSVDKLGKIGPEGVAKELGSQGVSESAAAAVLELAKIQAPDASFRDAVLDLWETTPTHDDADAQALLGDGLNSLAALIESVNAAVPGTAIADLSIARGLDYYTGAVYETTLDGHEDLGSICSGGRYDSLVAGGGFPGVGMSIGVSRLVSRLVSRELLVATRSVPSAVLVAVVDEAGRRASDDIAARLRARGIACEVSPTAAKFGKQIQYADKRGIPFVWFPGNDGDGEVKDIRSGEQVVADADAWVPPADDLKPRVVRG